MLLNVAGEFESELMTLAVLFHQLRFHQFNSFYLLYALRFLRAEFPGLPSYQRCLELLPRCIVPLSALFDAVKGQCTGITLLDIWGITLSRKRAAPNSFYSGSRYSTYEYWSCMFTAPFV